MPPVQSCGYRHTTAINFSDEKSASKWQDLATICITRARGVVWSLEIDTHQGQDRPQEAFRLAKRQPEDEPQRQRCLDREIRKLRFRPISFTRCLPLQVPNNSRLFCLGAKALDERRDFLEADSHLSLVPSQFLGWRPLRDRIPVRRHCNTEHPQQAAGLIGWHGSSSRMKADSGRTIHGRNEKTHS